MKTVSFVKKKISLEPFNLEIKKINYFSMFRFVEGYLVSLHLLFWILVLARVLPSGENLIFWMIICLLLTYNYVLGILYLWIE